MAYKTISNKAYANRAAFLPDLWAKLAAMGWTLVDGSCTPVTVAYTAVSIADDTFTSVGHTFVNGQPVQLTTTGGAPGGLAVLTQYYVVSVSGNTFKLSATYNGAGINITSQGTGNHTITEAFRIYSSNGEGSDRITQYVKFSWFGSATVVAMIASYSYNVTTHAQVAAIQLTYIGGMVTIDSGFYVWLYGNKDFVVIVTKISTTYNGQVFGHLNAALPDKTTLTADSTSGNSATLTVVSTEIFEVGSLYQIVGAHDEGRDALTIESIISTTQMTVVNLPRNYAAGAFIGDNPAPFMMGRTTYSTFCAMTCPMQVVGLNDASQYTSANSTELIATTYLDPDNRVNKYVLMPTVYTNEFNNLNSTAGLGAFAPDFFLRPPTALSQEDTIAVYKKDSGTSSGSNSSTLFNNTAKNWTVNAFAGMSLVITFGLGVGLIAKIASNTATQLTLDADFALPTVPDSTSQYVICKNAYRNFYLNTTLYAAFREGV